MKNSILVLTLALLPTLANATQITLILSDEQETDNCKVCIYENATKIEIVMFKPSNRCKHTIKFEE